jgi:hypothetical protein
MSRVIYGILCHHAADLIQDQYQLLFTPATRFIYHADEKAPGKLKQLLNGLALANPNVLLVAPALCSWAGYSLTEAMLKIISAAVEQPEWDHLAFLSEQHVPLRSARFIERALQPDHDYVEAGSVRNFNESGNADVLNRTARIYRELPGVGAFATTRNDPGEKFFHRLRHGTQWMTLCRRTCEELARAGGGEDMFVFQHSLLSDETAIQTWVHQLEGAEARNINRSPTFVAFPWRGGNRDMIFDAGVFFKAREKEHLFIRKRPLALPPEVTAYFEDICPPQARPPRLELSSGPEMFNESVAAQAVAQCLNAKITPTGMKLIDGHRMGNSPAVFYKLVEPRLKPPFGIYLVSQDLIHFKAVAVLATKERAFNETEIGGYSTSVIRARLVDLAYQREIHLADDQDFGFYTLKNLAGLEGLVALLSLFLTRMLAIMPKSEPAPPANIPQPATP